MKVGWLEAMTKTNWNKKVVAKQTARTVQRDRFGGEQSAKLMSPAHSSPLELHYHRHRPEMDQESLSVRRATQRQIAACRRKTNCLHSGDRQAPHGMSLQDILRLLHWKGLTASTSVRHAPWMPAARRQAAKTGGGGWNRQPGKAAEPSGHLQVVRRRRPMPFPCNSVQKRQKAGEGRRNKEAGKTEGWRTMFSFRRGMRVLSSFLLR